MKSRKGFTLIELVIVIAVIGILAAVAIPVISNIVNHSKKVVCEANRQTFIRVYETQKARETNNYTLEDAVNGGYPALLENLSELKCPSGGLFTVTGGEIICSVHDAVGDDEGGSGSESNILLPGDTVLGNVSLYSWDDLSTSTSALPWGGVNLSKGKVYVFEGKTYVVANNNYLSKENAATFKSNPSGLSFMQKFDSNAVTVNSSSYNSSTGWNPRLMNGTVFHENNKSYVFLGSDNTQWEKLPTEGGYWVLLTP